MTTSRTAALRQDLRAEVLFLRLLDHPALSPLGGLHGSLQIRLVPPTPPRRRTLRRWYAGHAHEHVGAARQWKRRCARAMVPLAAVALGVLVLAVRSDGAPLPNGAGEPLTLEWVGDMALSSQQEIGRASCRER